MPFRNKPTKTNWEPAEIDRYGNLVLGPTEVAGGDYGRGPLGLTKHALALVVKGFLIGGALGWATGFLVSAASAGANISHDLLMAGAYYGSVQGFVIGVGAGISVAAMSRGEPADFSTMFLFSLLKKTVIGTIFAAAFLWIVRGAIVNSEATAVRLILEAQQLLAVYLDELSLSFGQIGWWVVVAAGTIYGVASSRFLPFASRVGLVILVAGSYIGSGVATSPLAGAFAGGAIAFVLAHLVHLFMIADERGHPLAHAVLSYWMRSWALLTVCYVFWQEAILGSLPVPYIFVFGSTEYYQQLGVVVTLGFLAGAALCLPTLARPVPFRPEAVWAAPVLGVAGGVAGNLVAGQVGMVGGGLVAGLIYGLVRAGPRLRYIASPGSPEPAGVACALAGLAVANIAASNMLQAHPYPLATIVQIGVLTQLTGAAAGFVIGLGGHSVLKISVVRIRETPRGGGGRDEVGDRRRKRSEDRQREGPGGPGAAA